MQINTRRVSTAQKAPRDEAAAKYFELSDDARKIASYILQF